MLFDTWMCQTLSWAYIVFYAHIHCGNISDVLQRKDIHSIERNKREKKHRQRQGNEEQEDDDREKEEE